MKNMLPKMTRSGARALLADQRASVSIWGALILLVLLGTTALAVDMGYLFVLKHRLQATADAAALAGASRLPVSGQVKQEAERYAGRNMPCSTAKETPPCPSGETIHGGVLDKNADVVLGSWDSDTRTFFAGIDPINAVRVTTRRAVANGNPVTLFFARIFRVLQIDIAAEAVAYVPNGLQIRFLIDDEMIDSDIPVIENLAVSLGIPPGDLISDLDGDWFIDLPPGEILELPTGQVGDEALFDISHPAFPYSQTSSPSIEDFVNYNEDSSSWRYDLIPTADLDPLLGVDTVSDESLYASYVDPDVVHVSPVYKSDISALAPVGGVPAVNALGLRRGALAFKIIAVGTDPDGPFGSVLPNLVIEVVDPATINLGEVAPASVSGPPQPMLVN